METPQPASVFAIVRDLIFSSKITGTAKAVGTTVRVMRDPAQLGDEIPKLLIVDLSLPGIIEAVSAWKQSHPTTIVGFAAHVDAAAIAAARAAGFTVLARSGFVEALPQLLEGANS